MIRLVVGGSGGPDDVQLLASTEEDGPVVDVVKAGLVQSITLNIVPNEAPELVVKFAYFHADALIDSGTSKLPKWTGEGLLSQP